MGTNMFLHVEALVDGRWLGRTRAAKADKEHERNVDGPSERNYNVFGRLDDRGNEDVRGPVVPADRPPPTDVDMAGIEELEAVDGEELDLWPGDLRWATVEELRKADWTLRWTKWAPHGEDGPEEVTDLSGTAFVKWLRGPDLDAVCAEVGGEANVRLIWWWA